MVTLPNLPKYTPISRRRALQCVAFSSMLEGKACYAGQLLTFYAVLAHFRPILCTVVTLILFCNNISTIEGKKEEEKN